MKCNINYELVDVKQAETRLFTINEVDGKFELVWRPLVKMVLENRRYFPYYSIIDKARENAQTIINARLNTNSDIQLFGALIQDSIESDMYINDYVYQFFIETQIL